MHFQQYNFDLKFNSDSKNSWLFSLVDSYDKLIDLNGIPWAFSIVFYTRSTTSELHKQELRIANEERQFKIQQEQEKLVENVANREEAPITLNTEGTITDQPLLKTILPLGILEQKEPPPLIAAAMRPRIIFPKDDKDVYSILSTDPNELEQVIQYPKGI